MAPATPRPRRRMPQQTKEATATASNMTAATPKMTAATPKMTAATPKMTEMTAATPKMNNLTGRGRQPQSSGEEPFEKIARVLTDLSATCTEKEKVAQSSAKKKKAGQAVAPNGMTEAMLRSALNKCSKDIYFDQPLVAAVRKLAVKQGLQKWLEITEQQLQEDTTYLMMLTENATDPDGEGAECVRSVDVIKFLARIGKTSNRTAKTFQPIKGCCPEKLSKYAKTFLVIIRTAVMQEEYNEDTRNELICHAARYLMFSGILTSHFEELDSTQNKRTRDKYEYILKQCNINPPKNIDPNDKQQHDLDFKQQSIKAILSRFFDGSTCASPFVDRCYGYFKKLWELKNCPTDCREYEENQNSYEQLNPFQSREIFLSRFLLYDSDEDTSATATPSSELDSSLKSADGVIASSNQESESRNELVDRKTPGRTRASAAHVTSTPTNRKTSLFNAIAELASDPNEKKLSAVVVRAHEAYPGHKILQAYKKEACKDSPATKFLVDNLSTQEPNDLNGEEEEQLVQELRKLTKPQIIHRETLIPLMESADHFFDVPLDRSLVSRLAMSEFEMALAKYGVNKTAEDLRQFLAPRQESSSTTASIIVSEGEEDIDGDDVAAKITSCSSSPTDGMGEGLAGSMPAAPLYNAVGLLRNKDLFDFIKPDKDDQRVVKRKKEDVFSEDVKKILSSERKEPEDKEQLALAGYRVRQRDFAIIRFIGNGAIGFVFLAKHMPTGTLVALKSEWFESWGVGDYVVRVLENHALVNDVPGVMTLHDWFVTTEDGTLGGTRVERTIKKVNCILVTMVMEYCPGGQLSDLIKKRRANGTFTIKWILETFADLAAALVAFKNCDVVHRDLKLENILIGADGKIRIGDFGLVRKSTKGEEVGTCGAGTGEYRSIEGMQGRYSSGNDVYALGVILEKLCTDEEGTCTPKSMEEVISDGSKNKEKLKKLHGLIQRMTAETDATRIGVDEVVHELELILTSEGKKE